MRSKNKQKTLFHLLAKQILKCQESERDAKYFMDSALKILKIEDLKRDLKKIVTAQDAKEYSFLDLAVFCRNEKFNFVHKIFKIIPEEDRAQCQRSIDPEGEFQIGLENQDVVALLGWFHLSLDRQKLSLVKMRGPENVRLFHLLGKQILKDQETQDESNLINEPLKILKKLPPRDIKDIVTALDGKNRSFLDYAVLCRKEELNFMDEVFKLIPIADRDECLRFIFQKKLKSEELPAALVLFYRSKDSEKASLAKISGLKNMTLLQMLVMRIYQDLRKKNTSELLHEPVEVLKQIASKDRKEVANLQNSQGRNVFHLAALCKYQKFNLLCELLKIIPPQDRATCLKTQDSLQGWSPLHCKANATTHENGLNESSIQEILDLLLIEKDKTDVKEIRDRSGRTYIEIQEKKKQDEALFSKKEGARETYLKERKRVSIAAVVDLQKEMERSGLNANFLNARRRSPSAPPRVHLPPRGMTVADFGIPLSAKIKEAPVEPPKEPKEEPKRPKTPPNYLKSLERSIYDDLK